MAILAKSCLMPGTAAFICSILFTLRPVVGIRQATWASEFLEGCSHDLYEVRLPAYLNRLVTLTFLAHVLFHEHRIVPIALSDANDYALFPAKRLVSSDMTLHVLSATPDAGNLVLGLSVATLHNLVDDFDKIAQAWNLTTFSTKLKTAAKDSRDSLLLAQQNFRNSIGSASSAMLARYSISMRSHRSMASCIVPSETSNHEPPEPSLQENPHQQPGTIAVQSTENQTTGVGPLFNDHARGVLSQAHKSPVRSYAPPAVQSYVAFVSASVPHELSGHIVLCGLPNHLRDFIAPLRQAQRHTSATNTIDVVPIVIISNQVLSKKQYAGIAAFERVYYVRGSPLSLSVLAAARVPFSRNVVILRACCDLAVRDTDADVGDVIDQNMIDTDVITLHRFITEVCAAQKDSTRPALLIELSRPNSLRFLKDPTVDHGDSKALIRALTKIAISRADDPLDQICNPLYAAGKPSDTATKVQVRCAGKIFVSNSLDALLGTCNKYGSVLDVVQLLVLGETSGARTLEQMDIPPLLVGRPYGACFEEMLLTHSVLCLGLYRARPEADCSFVSVNPSPGIVLELTDKLFVLRLNRRTLFFMRCKRLRGFLVSIRARVLKPRKRDESFRRWVGRNLDKSVLGAAIDIFQAVLGWIVTGLYCVKNWRSWDNSLDGPFLRAVHAAIGGVFLFDYSLRLFASDNRESYVLAPLAVMDLLGIVPQFIELFVGNTASQHHLVFIGAIKTLRPFRCLCFFRLVPFARSARQRESYVLSITVMCIIICFGSIEQVDQSSTENA
ncbi:Voltage-gated Ion Channel (VIC) Superfamily [Achlya hypogyna]|uniref:Voltage-gated Ion Channel (VIC) Superfamily n=1 Tax=Achlya hypogyna TaxID=1202772 RepID=A0A1V9ZD17_ACHHY|nr:Voltage-gated Ion Channel (VIC) Superfamily [Achlya hypogyna]